MPSDRPDCHFKNMWVVFHRFGTESHNLLHSRRSELYFVLFRWNGKQIPQISSYEAHLRRCPFSFEIINQATEVLETLFLTTITNLFDFIAPISSKTCHKQISVSFEYTLERERDVRTPLPFLFCIVCNTLHCIVAVCYLIAHIETDLLFCTRTRFETEAKGKGNRLLG